MNDNVVISILLFWYLFKISHIHLGLLLAFAVVSYLILGRAKGIIKVNRIVK